MPPSLLLLLQVDGLAPRGWLWLLLGVLIGLIIGYALGRR